MLKNSKTVVWFFKGGADSLAPLTEHSLAQDMLLRFVPASGEHLDWEGVEAGVRHRPWIVDVYS